RPWVLLIQSWRRLPRCDKYRLCTLRCSGTVACWRFDRCPDSGPRIGHRDPFFMDSRPDTRTVLDEDVLCSLGDLGAVAGDDFRWHAGHGNALAAVGTCRCIARAALLRGVTLANDCAPAAPVAAT